MQDIRNYFLRLGVSVQPLTPERTVEHALFMHTHPAWFWAHERARRDRPLVHFFCVRPAFDPAVFAACLRLAAESLPAAVREMPRWVEFENTGITTMPPAACLGFFLLGFAQRYDAFPKEAYIQSLRIVSEGVHMTKKARAALDKLLANADFGESVFCDLLARWGRHDSRPSCPDRLPDADDSGRGVDALLEEKDSINS